MGERSRSRDLHDIVSLLRRPVFRQRADLGREVLEQRCDARGMPVRSGESIQALPTFSEIESE